MRTVKVESVELNQGKFERLQAVAGSYAKEKQAHLGYYQTGENFALARSERDRRDALVRSGYSSGFGLSSRLWKNAQKDAFETTEKYWAALAEEVRPRIYRLNWTENQRHYGAWLLLQPQRFNQLIVGRAPINEKIELSLKERTQVQNYLRRTVRRVAGNRPVVKNNTSFTIDSAMYSITRTLTGQAIEIVSLTARERIYVPLKGETALGGNLRVVIEAENRRIFIHTQYELPEVEALTGSPRGVDVGITEVFVDDEGAEYGKELKAALKEASDRLKETGQKRNRIHALRKKHLVKGNKKKAARIAKQNLGQKKQRAERKRFQAQVKTIINTAINQVVGEKSPAILVTEKLDFRGPAQSKEISRRVSNFHRSTLKERLEFKASVKGFDRKQVNPAYTSQTCPRCGFLDASNRSGERFQCLKCGYAGSSDRVGALNIKARLNDPEIKTWTPRAQVKTILQGRYNARLENLSPDKGDKVTVTGQTSETKWTESSKGSGEEANTPSQGSSIAASAPVRHSKSKTAGGKSTKLPALNHGDV